MDPTAPPPDSALVNEHADSADATVNTQNVHDTDPEGDGHALADNEAWARRLDALN